MTQRTTANTDIEGATPTLKAFFTDALGIPKEAELGRLGNFIRWPFQDWQGTALEFPEVRLQELTGTTIDLSEAISQYFHRGPGVFGKIVSITDTYNIVVDMPTSEVSSRKPQVYRQAEASTVEEVEQGPGTIMQQELTRYVEKTIDRLFESARELYFEDGMETDFSRDLVSLVKKYGNLAMGEISYLISYGRVDSEVAGEALRWLARINDPSTYGWRFWLLEKGLLSKSPVVRDSAALGLLSMCDANAIPDIRKAIERETIAELRDDLQGALRELEVSLDAIPATGNK
jgi:hypothetical protein